MDGYVDALAAFCDLLNASPLTGKGAPVSNGFVYQQRPRSPASGAVAYVTWISSPWEAAEGDLHNAVLSTLVLGVTEDNARKGAVALANYLRRLDGDPVEITAEQAQLLAVETVTGPAQQPGNEFAYLVDAFVNLQPI